MGFLSNLLTKEKKPVNRFQEIKKSFKERWYDKELDSLFNTKQHTSAERLLHQIVTYIVDLVYDTVSAYNDITVLTSPVCHEDDMYANIYDLNKIFSLGKNCERDIFNLCINISKISIMICNNIEDIDNCLYIEKILDRLESTLVTLGSHDIDEVYKNRVYYSDKSLKLLTTQFYNIYTLLYGLNQDIVYKNKVYRNQVKTTSRFADDQ